jgi:hypothetical protein
MRVSPASLAVAALVCGCPVSIAAGQVPDEFPECASPQVPQKTTVNGKIVIKCVRAPAPVKATPVQQFGDLIHGNRFHHGKHSYTFCASSKYTARSSHGTYRIANARRVRRKDGRVTIRAEIVLRTVKGKRVTLRSVLTKQGLKINGEMFGFGGPAPPSAKCAPA